MRVKGLFCQILWKASLFLMTLSDGPLLASYCPTMQLLYSMVFNTNTITHYQKLNMRFATLTFRSSLYDSSKRFAAGPKPCNWGISIMWVHGQISWYTSHPFRYTDDEISNIHLYLFYSSEVERYSRQCPSYKRQMYWRFYTRTSFLTSSLNVQIYLIKCSHKKRFFCRISNQRSKGDFCIFIQRICRTGNRWELRNEFHWCMSEMQSQMTNNRHLDCSTIT